MPPDLLTAAAVQPVFCGGSGFPEGDALCYDPVQGLLAVRGGACVWVGEGGRVCTGGEAARLRQPATPHGPTHPPNTTPLPPPGGHRRWARQADRAARGGGNAACPRRARSHHAPLLPAPRGRAAACHPGRRHPALQRRLSSPPHQHLGAGRRHHRGGGAAARPVRAAGLRERGGARGSGARPAGAAGRGWARRVRPRAAALPRCAGVCVGRGGGGGGGGGGGLHVPSGVEQQTCRSWPPARLPPPSLTLPRPPSSPPTPPPPHTQQCCQRCSTRGGRWWLWLSRRATPRARCCWWCTGTRGRSFGTSGGWVGGRVGRWVCSISAPALHPSLLLVPAGAPTHPPSPPCAHTTARPCPRAQGGAGPLRSGGGGGRALQAHLRLLGGRARQLLCCGV